MARRWMNRIEFLGERAEEGVFEIEEKQIVPRRLLQLVPEMRPYMPLMEQGVTSF